MKIAVNAGEKHKTHQRDEKSGTNKYLTQRKCTFFHCVNDNTQGEGGDRRKVFQMIRKYVVNVKMQVLGMEE